MSAQDREEPTVSTPPPPSSLRRSPLPLVILVLCGAPFMASLDLFIVNVAFPAIGREFSQSSLGGLSWVLNAYVLVYAALLIPLGRWADAFGARRVFLIGICLFVVGSAAAALSTALPGLVLARALQAVGAAALTPASLGLLITSVPAEKRAGSVRLWVSCSAVGSAMGPLLGGLLTELSWRWVFLVNLPIGIVLAVLAIAVLPRQKTVGGVRADLTGAVLAAVATGLLCLALVEGNTWGWLGTPTLLCLAGFLLASLWLLANNARSSVPLLPPAIMRVPAFAWANAAMLVFSASFAAGLLALSMWLQEVWGYTAVQTGLALTPGPLMVPVIALGAQRGLERFSPAIRAAVGSLFWAAGLLLIMMTVTEAPDYLGAILPGWLLAGIGVGLALPTVLANATSTLAPQDSSAGSAIINMTRQIGTVIGISVLVAVIAVDDRSALEAFRAAWWIIIGMAVAAALTALPMKPR